MKNLLTIIFAVSLAQFSLAQNAELKEVSGYAQKKFRDAPKKVFIAQFRVIYQLLFSQTEVAEGGRQLGGGYRGDAKAGLTMAVHGVDPKDLKEITNYLYAEYLKMYKDAGYEIISVDQAAKTEELMEYERKPGGTLNEEQFVGYLTSVPDGFDYLVKGMTGKGKEKGKFNGYKVSAELGGAIVTQVNLVVPFVVDAESATSKAVSQTVGGLAKIVMKPYLRIESEIAGTAGGFNTDVALTGVEYFYAEKAIKPEAFTNFQLNKNIDIPNVFEDKKYKASEVADSDLWGTSVGTMTLFNVSDKYLEKTFPITCDPAVYKKGVKEAGLSYLKTTFAEFQGYCGK